MLRFFTSCIWTSKKKKKKNCLVEQSGSISSFSVGLGASHVCFSKHGSMFFVPFYLLTKQQSKKMEEEEGKRGKTKFSNSLSSCLASSGLQVESLRPINQYTYGPRRPLLRNIFAERLKILLALATRKGSWGSIWKLRGSKPAASTLSENRREEKHSRCQSLLQIIKAQTLPRSRVIFNIPDIGLD